MIYLVLYNGKEFLDMQWIEVREDGDRYCSIKDVAFAFAEDTRVDNVALTDYVGSVFFEKEQQFLIRKGGELKFRAGDISFKKDIYESRAKKLKELENESLCHAV